MSISTPTLLDTVSSTVTQAGTTSNSISPAGNAILIAIAEYTTATSATRLPFSISDTFTPNLTWTKQREDEALDTTNTVSAAIVIFTAVTGATPGSGTVTVSSTGTATRRALHIIQVATGYNTVTPIKQSCKNNTLTSPLTLTFSASPDSDSVTIGAVSHRGSITVTKDADYTQLASTSAGTNHIGEVDYSLSPPDTTIGWTYAAGTATCGVAIEIDAAPTIKSRRTLTARVGSRGL